MKTADLDRELREAVGALRQADAEMLFKLGIDPLDVVIFGMVGRARIVRCGGLYEPDPQGAPAFVTPVFVDYPDGPETNEPWGTCRCGELIDLVAWHPEAPASWALRAGAATWLGAVYPVDWEPFPLHVWRGPFDWLQARCEGLALLTHEPAEIYRLLAGCAAVRAADEIQLQEIRRALSRPYRLPHLSVARPARPTGEACHV